MKKLLITIIASCFTALLFAQAPASNITVKGVVIDSATNKALDFVTVALQDAATNAPVKSTLTKADGQFELTAAAGKEYNVVLAFVGYANKMIPVKASGSTVDLGRILYASSAKQLNEVQVTGVKPVMKQEVDRISYDVQADPESKALTALDMIRKVPMLSVDGTDNIKLRGSGNYKILLNGKESALMARDPADVLKSMPATNIVKIEVITTPPAKYDAEGLAGIINIITQKKTDEGYNGSLNTNYNTLWGYRANVNATVKKGKFGYTGYVGTGKRPQLDRPFSNRTEFYDADAQPPVITSTLQQNGARFNGGNNTYTSSELSFEADTLNLFTGTFNYYRGNNDMGNRQFTEARNGSNALTQAYNLLNDGTSQYNGADAGINYQLGFKGNKEQLLTASYKYSNSGYNQSNDVTSTEAFNYTLPDYRQYNKSGTKEHTSQLDYVHPLKMVTIEAGGKMIARNSYSNFYTDVLTNGAYVKDDGQSNDFKYHQNVYGAYNSYLLKLTKWTLKTGVRYERTTIDANFMTTGSNLNEDFSNVVPSASIQRSLKNSSLTFGFTQRIQRPGIYQLNPFVDRSNPNYIYQGNPDLRPSVNNNFELGYSNFSKGSINISASYNFANNTIEELSRIDGAGITTTSYGNVGKNKNLGLDVNLTIPVTPKMNVNINSEIMHVWLRGTYNAEFYSNKGYQGHVFTNGSYKFDSGYRIGFNVGFDSRYVLLQGTDNYYIGYGLNGSKELLNKKLVISLAANGMFSRYNTLDFSTRTRDFYTYTYRSNPYRSFNFSVNYKFGSLSASIKKNQRGINNDDTSSGGSRN